MTQKHQKRQFTTKKLWLFSMFGSLGLVPIASLISCSQPSLNKKDIPEIFLNSDFNQNKDIQAKFEKYNQIHILNEINDYFEKIDHDDLFIFKNGADPKNVTFDQLMKNNFLIKYMDFNQTKFKSIIEKQFQLSDDFLKRLKFSVDYNNIFYDPGNYFDILIPVNVRLYLENHDKAEYAKGMFINQAIKLRVANVKYKDKEKYSDLLNVYQKIKAIKDSDFEIQLKDSINSKTMQDLIEKWGINQLDTKQLNEIFAIKNSIFENLQKENSHNEKIKLKMTAFDVDFNDETLARNEGILKIRLGVINVDSKQNKKELTNSVPEAGITFNVKFKFDNEFLTYLKLKETIKISTIFQNEINTDHTNLKKDNLIIKSNNRSIKKIEVMNLKSINFRQSEVSLNVYLENQTQPIIIKKYLGTNKDSLLFEKEFTKRNIKAPNFVTDRITTTNLASIKKDFFIAYNSSIFSGGYGISRGFYGNDNIKTPSFLHFGEDYLAPDYQAIVMPYDGQMIAAYELPAKNAWTGVGTVVVIKIPVANLDWSPKEKEIYLNDNKSDIYLSFLHLDAQKTLNNPIIDLKSTVGKMGDKRAINVAEGITPQSPKEIKKGTIIGYLGNEASNGGWMSHVHINLYSNRKQYLSPNYFSIDQKPDLDESRINKYYDSQKNLYTPIGNIGVIGNSLTNVFVNQINPVTGEEIKKEKDKKDPIKLNEIALYKNNLSITNTEIKKGYLNPNIIYNLRNDKTISFGIEEFFNLNQ